MGPVYRITAGSHRNQVLSMRGAIARGGRFNLRGYFGTLYTSLEPAVAFREMKRYFTVPPDGGFVLATLTLRLSQVVDLSNPLLRRTARINLRDLTGEDYAPTTEIGYRAWEAGVEGLIVPSAAVASALNLVLFLDNQHPRWTVGLDGLEPVEWESID